MNSTPKTIEPLQRVVVALQAGSGPDRADLTPDPLRLDFIIGVQSEGLNTFEVALLRHMAGDRFTVKIPAAEIETSFGHILPPSAPLSLSGDTVWLHAHILEATTPAPRAVISALAAVANAASCGGGGDCGCGCGAH